MITLNPTTRRQEGEFAAALESSRGAEHPELGELVALAAALRPAPVTVRADFRAELRERLLAEPLPVPAQRRPKPVDVTVRRPGRRRITGLVTAAVVASGAGTAYASADALPGDSLYPVKRGLESADLRVVAFGDKARGQRLIGRSDTRLGEVEELVADPGSTPVVAEALDDFAAASHKGAHLVFEAYEANPDTSLLVELDGQLVTQQQRILAMLPGLPGDSYAEGDRTLARLVHTGGEVARLLAGCAGCPAVLSAGTVVEPMLASLSLPLTAAAVRDVETGGGAPTGTPTPTPLPTPSPGPSASPLPTPTPGPSPEPSPLPSPTPKPSTSQEPSTQAEPSPTQTPSPAVEPSPTVSETPEPSVSQEPAPSSPAPSESPAEGPEAEPGPSASQAVLDPSTEAETDIEPSADPTTAGADRAGSSRAAAPRSAVPR